MHIRELLSPPPRTLSHTHAQAIVLAIRSKHAKCYYDPSSDGLGTACQVILSSLERIWTIDTRYVKSFPVNIHSVPMLTMAANVTACG